MKFIKKLTFLSVLLCTLVTAFALNVKVNAADTTVAYTFANYTAGTQYAEGEEHVLDENVTIVTTQAHFTTELRLYSSSTHNGYAIIKASSGKVFKSFGCNAGNKVDTLNVYGSNDGGFNWELIGGISITSTSYKDYTLDFTGDEYKQLKLDVVGTNQVRLKNITLKLGESSGNGSGDSTDEIVNEVFKPVTSVSELSTGDKVVIANATGEYALGTEQRSNNRTAVAVSKKADGSIVIDKTLVQILTLETGNVLGTYAFNTGNGYLYAASSSGNYLRTETTLSNNSSFLVTIENGSTSVTAQGEYTRNIMRFNPNNGEPIFACYGSATETAVAIYKYVDSATINPEDKFGLESTQASLRLSYNTSISSGNSVPVYKKVTSINELIAGKKVIIVATTNTASYALSTAQNSNNRGATEVAIENDSIELTNNMVQVLTLEEGSATGTFAFNTGAGYLYAAGGTGKNNYLRTKNALDGAGSFNISITDGKASVVASDATILRNTLMYNATSTLFSCYASGQTAIQIYIENGVKTTDVTSYEVTKLDLRFGTCIDAKLYDELIAKGATFGVAFGKVSAVGELSMQEALTSNLIKTVEVEPANVDKNDGSGELVKDGSGAYYQFAAFINNIPNSGYETDLVAACYVEIDGEYYFMAKKVVNVVEIADLYIEQAAALELEEADLAVLKQVAGK